MWYIELMMETEKVIRNGMVAVLYSPGFGAGWSTWADDEHHGCMFHPELVAAVEAGDRDKAARVAQSLYGDSFFIGGARDLTIKWLPVGTLFVITEYDGSESIETRDRTEWVVA